MVKKNPLFKSRDRFPKELVFYKDFQGFKAHIRSKNFQTPKEMRKYLEETGFEIITSEVNQAGDSKWLEIFSRKL